MVKFKVVEKIVEILILSIFFPVKITVKGDDNDLMVYWIFPWQRKLSLGG